VALRWSLLAAREQADLLIIAGDITQRGRVAEAEAAADLLGDLGLPVVAVLGNHDRRGFRRSAFRSALAAAGVWVLDGDSIHVVTAFGVRIGIAGASGSGGGFWSDNHAAMPHGRAFHALAIRLRSECERMHQALATLDGQVRIAVTHFAPTESTLMGEPAAKRWMLGNAVLGRVIDGHGVDLVVHGHAHAGCPSGATVGGVPVRNVALPVNGGVVIVPVPVRRATGSTVSRS
jgi:Icc-related predicted phosphoesterase